MSDESQKDEIKDETHQLEDIEQDELEDHEEDEFEDDEEDEFEVKEVQVPENQEKNASTDNTV
jgi:hypothetical protein